MSLNGVSDQVLERAGGSGRRQGCRTAKDVCISCSLKILRAPSSPPHPNRRNPATTRPQPPGGGTGLHSVTKATIPPKRARPPGFRGDERSDGLPEPVFIWCWTCAAPMPATRSGGRGRGPRRRFGPFGATPVPLTHARTKRPTAPRGSPRCPHTRARRLVPPRATRGRHRPRDAPIEPPSAPAAAGGVEAAAPTERGHGTSLGARPQPRAGASGRSPPRWHPRPGIPYAPPDAPGAKQQFALSRPATTGGRPACQRPCTPPPTRRV